MRDPYKGGGVLTNFFSPWRLTAGSRGGLTTETSWACETAVVLSENRINKESQQTELDSGRCGFFFFFFFFWSEQLIHEQERIKRESNENEGEKDERNRKYSLTDKQMYRQRYRKNRCTLCCSFDPKLSRRWLRSLNHAQRGCDHR
jgi:hypothetical protein